MVPELAHTLRESHTHDVWPGETSADRQKWTRDNFDFLRDHIVHSDISHLDTHTRTIRSRAVSVMSSSDLQAALA